jgi:PAS domain S-box-containing protein
MTPNSEARGGPKLPRSWRDWAWTVLVAVSYFAAAKFGLSLAFATKQVTAVWPPTGVAFAALWLLGYRVWPGILLGAFLANATVGESSLTAFGIAAGNTLAAVASAFMARRRGFDPRIGKPRDVLVLVLFGAGLGSAVSATAGVANLVLGGLVPPSAYWSVWGVWWLGDAMGVLLFAPFLLSWLGDARPRAAERRPGEAVLLYLALAAVCQLTFSGQIVPGQYAFRLYTVFPFVIWAAVRFGQRAATLAAVAIAGFAIWGAIHERGPFAILPVEARLTVLDVFMGVVAVTALTLGAVVAERGEAEAALQRARDELELRVQQRTMELKHEQERLAEAQRLASLGSWQWDPAMRRVTWSDELYRIFGRDKATFTGTYEEFLACVHPEDRHRVEANIRATLAGEGGFQQVHRILRDGELRYVESRGSVQSSSDGQVERLVGTVQDVTAREQQQAKLRESDTFFELSSDMLCTASGGYLRRINPAFKRLGYSEAELLAKPFIELVHPDDVPATLVEVLKLKFGIKTLHFENRYRCKDGSYCWISWVASPDPAGVFYGTARDITEQKRSEAEREQLNEQLLSLNRSLTGTLKEREILLQEIHHRVKNNLQVISSLINLQIRKLEEGENRDALEECRTRVQAIALIHEKLYQSSDYARVPFGEYAKSLAASVLQTTTQSTANVRLELALEPIELAVDQAIPCGLVLNELITNAIKHGFRDGRAGVIRVEFSRRAGGFVRLAVKNDGIRLPDALESGNSPSLGLHLVSTLASQLGATLEVERELCTAFQLTFKLPEENPVRADS